MSHRAARARRARQIPPVAAPAPMPAASPTPSPRHATGARPPAERPAAAELAPGARAAALVYALLALAYFLPAFFHDRQLFGTDYLAAAYPVHEFAASRLAEGALPAWVPHLYGGLPFHANPGSTYYPARLLLALVLPLERVLPALLVVQLAVAGLGTYLLARELGARRWVAFVTGLAFEFTGVTMSAVYAGHDGRLIVATLAPLLLWCLHRGARTGAAAPFAGAGATLGAALLSFQLQSCYYLLLAAAAWGAFLLVRFGYVRRPGALARVAGLGVAAVAAGFALAAVDLLPFAGYLAESPRGGAGGPGYAFSVSFSMPPAELTGLAAPEQAGVLADYRGANPFKFHTEYAGALVLVLVALGAWCARRDAYWRFFAGLGAFALTVAFGGHTPLYRLYYALLPGVRQTRAPAIAFFLVSLSLAMMAGLALERLAALRDASRAAARTGAARPPRALGRIALAVPAAAVLAAVAALGSARGTDATAGWLRFALAAAAVGGVLHAWHAGRLGARAAAVALAVVGTADLAAVARPFFRTDAPPADLYAADDVVDFLRARPARGGAADRVWVLPGSAAGAEPKLGAGRFGARSNYLMHWGVESAGGEHGNQLRRWDQYVGTDSATGVVDWRHFVEWTPFMEAANVGYVVSRTRLDLRNAADGRPLAGFRLVHDGTAKVYRNDRALPRAYLVPAVRPAERADDAFRVMRSPTWDPRRLATVEVPAGGEHDAARASLAALTTAPAAAPAAEGSARVVTYEPDRVVVRAETPRAALLVLADNFAPGWTALVDGRPAPIVRANTTLRGLALTAGAHEVVFAYRPAALYRGAAVSAVTALLLAAFAAGAAARGRGVRRRAAAAGAPA